MASAEKRELLRKLPSVNDLLETDTVAAWLGEHPRPLVVDCLREAVEDARRQLLDNAPEPDDAADVTERGILESAAAHLATKTNPHLRKAINATGIILHTGLGRAVWSAGVVDSMIDGLKGYVTLAIDRETGKRSERDGRIEYILTELTGAEAATVVNNNAAATMLVLAAMGVGKEVIVSRGQLIEIGGSFRLPDVMAQSRAVMVEVGTTNRTHLRDYENAITDETTVIFRAHPSNYRIVGFTCEVPLKELVELAHSRGLVMVDDLGAGALIGLERFGLPHEPTIGESIAAGADVVVSSADKLIGAGQGGVIVGSKQYIEKIRKHPLARAFRPDKTCLMALERTLGLFRDPDRLVREHPTYRMLATSQETLRARADSLADAIEKANPAVRTEVIEGVGYLGSGSLPMEALRTRLVALSAPSVGPDELARSLRMDQDCIFTRIDNGKVVFDVRTLSDEDIPQIAAAVKRIAQ